MFYPKKILILLTVFFFLFCLTYLAYTENKQQNYNYGKSWWTVYFIDPQENNLSFIIENHSNEKKFHWEILAAKDHFLQGDVSVELGEKKTVNISSPQEALGKKIDIKVSTPKNSKELYKNF